MAITTKQRQVKEIIKCGKDPSYFFNRYIKIQHPIRGSIPFKTYDFQDSCVADFEEHRFNIVLKSRQLGLSTISAAYCAWLAIFHKDKNILVIATKLAVAQNFIRKVKFMIRSMPKWLLLPSIVNNNKQAIEFSNGSTVKAIPTSEDAGRSEALSLLIVDEAAFVRNFDTLWTGLYPTLSTGGRAIVLSTPNGVGGQYYDLWMQAENKENVFNAIKLPWDVHPDRDDKWFEEETKNMSRQQIAQELLCDFQASGDTFLQVEDIEYIRNWIRPPIDKWGPDMNVWVWEYPYSAKKYVISADVSRGDASDYSTFHVIDTEKSSVVAEYRGKLPPDKFAQVLAEAGRRYNNALLCPENNSYGYAVIMKLSEMDYRNLYFINEKERYSYMYGNKELGKIGFQTNAKTRNQILTKLEEVLRTKQVLVKSSRLYEELKTFVWKNGKAQAQKGQNDDLIIALAIGVWLYDTSPQLNKNTTDVNKAMLAAFSINSKKINESVMDRENNRDPDGAGGKKNWGKHNPYANFDWVMK
tara:strand:+ start:184 stop:1761 length:1578 start_codon:yes stop_codon:yes gene_type:complete